MKDKHGGPAFPVSAGNYNGMTLRDYFASSALPYIFELDSINGRALTFNDMANIAYELADAMLKERNK